MSTSTDANLTVLNVNDVDASRYVITHTLRRAGFTVIEASSGTEALTRVNERPDIVVLDVILPDLDGYEVCRRIKANPATASTPVLLTSAALVRTVDRVQGLEGGADGYLVQPAEPIELAATVRALVRARRAEDALASARRRAAFETRFLADAGEALGASLEVPATLAHVARLSVPALADWCQVDLAEPEGGVRCVEVTFLDPALSAASHALKGVTTTLGADHPATEAMHANRPVLLTDVPEARYAQVAQSPAQLKVFRALAPRTLLYLPLCSRGQRLGVITLAGASAERRFHAGDLALAQDFARRSATAIDNAQLYQSAQEAARLKDAFLATVSHELRTPLQALLGWTRMLCTGAVAPERQRQVFETLARNARAQAQIVDDILDVSRIISGRLHVEFHRVDLAAMVSAAVDVVRPTAEVRGVILEHAADWQPEAVLGDAERLQQVVWNLVANAVKFTPRGGRVEIGLSHDDASVVLSVKDTGKGIAPEFLPHVFERFSQSDSSMTRRHGGLGLGLAITRHLVELHGGTVEAFSEGEGHGSTFCVRLPRVEGYASVVPPELGRFLSEPPRAPSPSLAGVHVLVVDDEPDALDLLATVLSSAGAEVTTAASAREALAAFDARRPDVLLSDIGMPGEDGYSLIRRVRARSAQEGGQTPAAALTAYARSEDIANAVSAGFNCHAAKPIDPSALVSVVAGLAPRREPVSATAAPRSP